MWGYFICINSIWLPFLPHIILSCMFNWCYNFTLSWMLYLWISSVSWITPCTFIWIFDVYLIQPVYYLTYNVTVYGDSSSVCWIFPVPVYLPRGWVKFNIFNVIFLIESLHSEWYLPPSIVTGHYKEILIGFGVAFRYYVLRHITSPVVMHEIWYNVTHIW